jgi:hypothetical protein
LANGLSIGEDLRLAEAEVLLRKGACGRLRSANIILDEKHVAMRAKNHVLSISLKDLFLTLHYALHI